MKSQLAWPRVLRDIGIILFIAAALFVALEIATSHAATSFHGSGPPAAHDASPGGAAT